MTEPTDFLFDGAETYEEKQDDYGDSWRRVGEFLHELADGDTVELETQEDFIAFGLFTRRLDKLARAFNGEFLADDMNFESVLDSHLDEMVYSAMHASNQEEREKPGKQANLVPTIFDKGDEKEPWEMGETSDESLMKFNYYTKTEEDVREPE